MSLESNFGSQDLSLHFPPFQIHHLTWHRGPPPLPLPLSLISKSNIEMFFCLWSTTVFHNLFVLQDTLIQLFKNVAAPLDAKVDLKIDKSDN